MNTNNPLVVYNNIEFVNAQKMHELYPDTFGVPSSEDLERIKVGTLVKVCVDNQERFWTEVMEIQDNIIRARIDNDVFTSNLKYNDVIEFGFECIYDIW